MGSIFFMAGVIHLPRPFVPFGMRGLPRKVRTAERKVRFISWRRLRLPFLVPKMTFGLMCGLRLERGGFGGVECSKRRLQGDDTPSQWFIVSRFPFFVCALENWRCTAVFFFLSIRHCFPPQYEGKVIGYNHVASVDCHACYCCTFFISSF